MSGAVTDTMGPMPLRAIRGATTLERDERAHLHERTQELVEALVSANSLATDDIVSVIFTCTPDIVSDFPAAAARELGHSYIGTEHILLAQWGEPESLAVVALDRMGVTRPDVVEAIEAITPRGDTTEVTGGFTPRAWVALGNTVGEALGLGHNYVGTEHMLLALLGGVGGMAAQILDDHGVDHEQTKSVVVELLSGFSSS